MLGEHLNGYNGKLQIATPDGEPARGYTNQHLNKDDPYGNKFLVYPRFPTFLPNTPRDYNYGRIVYTFTPTKETNIYTVPGIGDVILNDPGHGEAWFGKLVSVVFDKGFQPPKIITPELEDDSGISAASYAALGQHLVDDDDDEEE
jgi:hypothetical protein